ncbi:hypothetical protein [Cyclobacterium marinum]|uniref:hypothetical protein n=1 Tax=Cyclobacterium marinum TaxID=104 RepID=UPI0011ED6238|nr:hypothetical protein [Cyclobacterium marinum]MBI0400563.1 hypothetical protein [Cyclobacterium marinum]
MNITKRDLKLILPFLIFVIVGISGVYSVDFITGEQTLAAAIKWCGIPTLIFALYYSYQATFGHRNDIPIWKNLLGTIVLIAIISLITLVSFQGYLILINSHLGQQKKYLLTGQITKLDFPKEKKIGNKYSIEIARKLEQDTISLDVPTNGYIEAENFTKTMKMGSLGFIYSKN